MADELLITLNHLKTILPIVEKNITEKTIRAPMKTNENIIIFFFITKPDIWKGLFLLPLFLDVNLSVIPSLFAASTAFAAACT